MSLFFKSLCTALTVFSLVSCGSSHDKPEPINTAVVNPDASDQTDLQLNGAVASQIILENGLKVIVVSSPTSKQSSVAVGAQIGQYDDPIHAQGLSHFLEHMLFLGTKEFPVVGDYKQFLNANNGGSNAYTSGNHTNYYLNVRSDKFEEAVNRLSRFFVSPLFDATFVEKEKSAIHNEYNLRFESFKSSRAFMAFTKVEGQYRGFGVGNEDSLANATAEDTRELFDKHYYAENMHAVLSGPQSVEELKALAEKYLSDIKSNPDAEKNKYDEFLQFDFDQLPARLNVKANDQTKELEIFIPTTNPNAENRSARGTIGSLMGDESPESLMVVLQKAGLARTGAGAISGGAYPSGLTVTVQLSEEGLSKTDEIVNLTLGYIEFLKNQKLPAYFAEENQLTEAAAKVAAQYFDVNSDLTQNINRAYFSKEGKVPNWKTLFTGESVESATDEGYKAYLNSLNVDKVLLISTNPDNKDYDYDFEKLGDIEKAGIDTKMIGETKVIVDSLYNFAYEVASVDTSKYSPKGSFVLKKSNAYIPRAFEIFKDGPSEAFAKTEDEWGYIHSTDIEDTVLPMTFMNLEIMSDKVDFSDPKDATNLFLLREMLRQQSASQSYAMASAGFEIAFPIYIDKGAIGMTFSGWSDTYEKAFSDVLGFTNLAVDAEEFESLKAFYTDQTKREAAGEAGRIGSRLMFSGVTPAYLNYEDLFNFSGLHVRGALSGNLKNTTLETVVSSVKESWTPNWAERENWSSLYGLESLIGDDSSAENYLNEQLTEGNSEGNALYTGFWSFGKSTDKKELFVANIMGQWLEPDYYEELRTRQQLAYSLYAAPWNFVGHNGLRVNLLSSTEDVNAIETAVDSYILKWAAEVLPTKSEELLQSTVENMLIRRERAPTVQGQHGFYSMLVSEGYESIESYEQDEEVLTSITLKDVVDYGTANLVNREKSGSFVKVTKKKDEPILAP